MDLLAGQDFTRSEQSLWGFFIFKLNIQPELNKTQLEEHLAH